MSQEKVLETLENFGLTKADAQIYVFVGKKGPQKAKDITKSLRVPKQTLYRAIKTLQSKGLITATLEHPAKFAAVPFERVIDLFVKAKTEEAHSIEQGKQDLLLDWQSIAIAEAGDQSPRFTVIEGRNYIYPRLKQMVEETKNQLSIISHFPGLIRAEQFGILDAAFNHAVKTNAKFRFITELSDDNLKAMKVLLKRIPKGLVNFEGRTPELGLKLISRMLIRDDSEAVFFITQETDRIAGEVDDVCLWTNSSSIVNSFTSVFEDLWHNSTNIEKRIAEIETGKPTAKTCIMSDPEVARKKYDDAMKLAKAEIIMVASSSGLVQAWINIAQLKERAEKGISIKIMAPITSDNLEGAIRLSECFEVRHVPASYLRTTIVDGKHLFQFKNPESNQTKSNAEFFEDTYYTNDAEYIKETRNMLENIWRNAQVRSAITLETISKPLAPTAPLISEDEYAIARKESPWRKMLINVEEHGGVITEEYVLNKMLNAKKVSAKDPLKDIVRLYGSSATAVIYPPKNFNLPSLIIMAFHCNKLSSFGAEDWFQIYLMLETSNGQAYVPVAVFGDSPKGMEWRRTTFAGTPAGQNCRLLKKDELQIQVQGNTLFAGWTVPIPLFSPQYTLPPACLLLEGYSRLKTSVTTAVLPSGSKVTIEGNGFDAFTTFFHPESKYAGPGTDGTLGRDMVFTAYPPSLKSKK